MRARQLDGPFKPHGPGVTWRVARLAGLAAASKSRSVLSSDTCDQERFRMVRQACVSDHRAACAGAGGRDTAAISSRNITQAQL
eukprot:6169807-Pleurochrysis_carterae.AAC.1